MVIRIISIALLLNACAGIVEAKPDAVLAPLPQNVPNLSNYPEAVSKNLDAQHQSVAALLDYQTAAAHCRTVHNFYESRAKTAEAAKLGVGVVGGVFGVVGGMLAAAGTGGLWPGISAGVAGVASTTLGTAEKGPLGTASYSTNRELVAKAIATSAAKLDGQKTGDSIYRNAVVLLAACPVPSE
ncbi:MULTISPECIES: hypothetical protein [Pseudomonas]|nr:MULTISPECIES: hypothetical protein [Pseudomonas]PMZ02378.1 hypothetical protein C1Y07_20615 [Pseudomonas sp. FW306-02-F02-AB]PMZ06592.1 hypothetical protein C1Y06_28915 [Pseudomonas sp. FW306-02-H06C]PMZ18542.1 hypothetical protein C1Y09_28840 [Pseudomonas sp. FW306-02-F08-AA]PMZ24335.1 hypothetical protein C1Y05_29245 [Pseudomonas sp. FW306-02-F04-BA]PMZ30887.1 hypothetical protein C1X99_29085 [Pseudomonas sp. FW306-02-H06B]